MSDLFISVVAIQPTIGQVSKPGAVANIRGTLSVAPSAGLFTAIRQGGVKTK